MLDGAQGVSSVMNIRNAIKLIANNWSCECRWAGMVYIMTNNEDVWLWPPDWKPCQWMLTTSCFYDAMTFVNGWTFVQNSRNVPEDWSDTLSQIQSIPWCSKTNLNMESQRQTLLPNLATPYERMVTTMAYGPLENWLEFRSSLHYACKPLSLLQRNGMPYACLFSKLQTKQKQRNKPKRQTGKKQQQRNGI